MMVARVLMALSCVRAVDLSGERLFADVVNYSASGEHRTGSDGLAAARSWFAGELEALGYEVRAYEYAVESYFELETCSVVVDGVDVECFPLWPAFPGSGRGRLGSEVAVVNASGIGLEAVTEARVRAAIAGGAEAVLVANGANADLGADPRLPVAMNVDVLGVNASDAAWGAPVVVVPRSAALRSGGTDVEVTLRGTASSKNDAVLHATLEVEASSGGGAAEPVVVEAGLSGWHACGGERGPGVALALGVARWHAERVANGSTRRPYHFFGTSGHELGASMGLPDFYAKVRGLGLGPTRVRGWLHTGSATTTYASFDPATGAQFAKSAYLQDSALAACADAPLRAAGYAPEATSPGGGGGGVAELIDHGYAALGFWGSFPRFHTRDDDQTSVGPKLLEPVAAAFVDVLTCLEDVAPR